MEVWKQIPGFGGHYEASSAGRIRSKRRIVIKKTRWGGEMLQEYPSRTIGGKPGAKGYVNVHISVDGRRSSVPVHRMVLLAFVGPPLPGQEACHNNGNQIDNRAENLRWDSHYENNQDRLRHGTYQRGEDHPMVKFDEGLVRSIIDGSTTVKDAIEVHGMSMTHAYRIKKGAAWAHIQGGQA